MRSAYLIISEWNDETQNIVKILKFVIAKYLQQPFARRSEITAEQQQLCARLLKMLKELELITDIDTDALFPANLMNEFCDQALNNQFMVFREDRLDLWENYQESYRLSIKLAESPFVGHMFESVKNGGANSSGELGGWYTRHTSSEIRVLIKKEAAIEKVIGEYLAGIILNAIYEELNVSKGHFAKVSLIRPRNANKNDKSGNDVYLVSECIPSYQGDLWELAWKDEGGEKPHKRPPGIFHPRSLEWTDKFILENNLQTEFAQLIAPRLLLGDFGVHNGNFGVVRDANANLHLAALDYGAAFNYFDNELMPYQPFKGFTDFYKNHFLDYGIDVNASEAMAHAFIKVGKIDIDTIKKAIQSGLNNIRSFYGAEALQAFRKRIGMDDNNQQSISNFLVSKIRNRQESIKKQGYGLLLEHCIEIDNEHNHIDSPKLRRHLNFYKNELKSFFGDSLSNYQLVRHNPLQGVAKLADDRNIYIFRLPAKLIRHNHDAEIKQELRAAALNCHKHSGIIRKKRGFWSKHLETILYVALIWMLAAAAIACIVPLAFIGLPTLALAGIAATAGAVLGLLIGMIGCAIKDSITSNSTPTRQPGPIGSSPARIASAIGAAPSPINDLSIQVGEPLVPAAANIQLLEPSIARPAPSSSSPKI